MFLFGQTFFSDTVQLFGSRTTFWHADRTTRTHRVLSSDLSAILLPFLAFVVKLYFFSLSSPALAVKSYSFLSSVPSFAGSPLIGIRLDKRIIRP